MPVKMLQQNVATKCCNKMLQQCCNNVATLLHSGAVRVKMLQQCCNIVATMLQHCCAPEQCMFFLEQCVLKCCNIVATMLQQCCNNVATKCCNKMLQQCCNNVATLLRSGAVHVFFGAVHVLCLTSQKYLGAVHVPFE